MGRAETAPRPPARRGLRERLFPPRKPTLVFDPRLCTGCGACESVCSARDNGSLAPALARVRILNDGVAGRSFAILCQHCLRPVCMEACPEAAISRDADGIVRIDEQRCVHCGLCAMACPEAAPLRHGADNKVRKCDLCGGEPQCVEHCPQQAISFSRGKSLGWVKLLRWPVQVLSFLLLVVVLVGTFCSVSIGAFNFSCPLGVLQNIVSSKGIILATVLSALFLVALTVVAGRLFCGWICPFGFFLDVVGKLVPRRIVLPGFLRARAAKYGVLGGALGVSALAGSQVFCAVCPIGATCRSFGVQAVVGGSGMAVIPALAALEATQRRAWCRYFCPVGALLALCARIGLVKIVIGAHRCKKFSCMRCADVCPMGIIGKADLEQGTSPALPLHECIYCLRCLDICPHGAVKLRFRWQKTTPEDFLP